MKILQVSPAYYPAISIGGPIQSSLALARMLAKNHEVTVLTTDLGLNAQQLQGIRFGTKLVSPFGGDLFYQRYFGNPNFTFSPGTWQWLRKNVREFDLVILHGVWNFPLIVSAMLCRRLGIPYVMYPHGTLYEETIHLRSGLKKKVLLWLAARKCLESASRVIFTTADEQRRVMNYLKYDLKYAIVPNIVNDLDLPAKPARGKLRDALGIGRETFALLHLGRITEKKNIAISIRTLAELRKSAVDTVLIVAGGDEADQRAELEALSAQLDVSSYVFFTGLLDRRESMQALIDSDVFVLPSLSENFGVAVVEAMLAEVPVVISDRVGISNEMKSGVDGIVVPLSDGVNGLCNGINSLISDAGLRESIGKEGRNFARRNFSEDAVRHEMQELLVQIRNGR